MKKNNFSPQSIIVRMPNWIGDLVMATPLLSDLRYRFPQARISAMCLYSQADLLRENPHIDELFLFKKQKGAAAKQQTNEIISHLKKRSYDLGILTTNSFSSAWWFWKGGIKYRLGFKGNWRRFLLNIPVTRPQSINSQHLVTTYKSLLTPLGIEISQTAPQIFLTEKEIEETKKTLLQHESNPSHHIYIGINPGAAYGSAKCWLPERFKELINCLLTLHSNLRIIVFGDQLTKNLVDELCEPFPIDRVWNFAGKTSLRQLISLIKICDLLITNDSGPMHIASALGTKLLAIFGSTNDKTTGPYNGGITIHKHVKCSPCYLRTCPIDFRCMKQITTEEVFHISKQILYPS